MMQPDPLRKAVEKAAVQAMNLVVPHLNPLTVLDMKPYMPVVRVTTQYFIIGRNDPGRNIARRNAFAAGRAAREAGRYPRRSRSRRA